MRVADYRQEYLYNEIGVQQTLMGNGVSANIPNTCTPTSPMAKRGITGPLGYSGQGKCPWEWFKLVIVDDHDRLVDTAALCFGSREPVDRLRPKALPCQSRQ